MKKVCPVCENQFDSGDLLECPHDQAFLLPISEDFVGKSVAHYEILALVGKGGMGNVFRARHTLLDRDVAIKMLHAHLVSDPQTLRRFQQEAKAVSSLVHPNIVAAREFALTTDGQPYIVMDFVEGKSLGEIIRERGVLDWQRFLNIFVPVCEALVCAHSNGVIHRDIKPGNIIISVDDQGKEMARLVDFGIAKIEHPDGDSIGLTRTGDVVGSPLYMSPEQCMCRRVDVRTDIYSLGCVMYEACTGQTPFHGSSAYETIFMHVHEQPRRFNAVCPKPLNRSDLEKLVLKMLEKDPDNRCATAQEVLDALKTIESGKRLILKIEPKPEYEQNLKVMLATSFAIAVVSSLSLMLTVPGTRWEYTAGVFVGVVLLCALVGLTVYGRSGLMMRFARLAYIPPERISEHKRFIREYSGAPDRGGLSLGTLVEPFNMSFQSPTQIALKAAIRKENPHMLFIGSSGTGKTHLLSSFLAQDILTEERAAVVLDAQGELVDLIGQWSVAQGAKVAERIALLDFTSIDKMAFNPFQLFAGMEALEAGFLIASAMRAGLLVVQPNSQWSEQTADMLRDCSALLYATGEPLTKLPEVTQDAIYREALIDRLPVERKQRAVKTHELYRKLIESGEWSNNAVPFVHQIESVVRDRLYREALESSNTFDLKSILYERRILLVKMPTERMGSKASLFANFVFAALRHQIRTGKQSCSLFVDGTTQLLHGDTLVDAMRAPELGSLAIVSAFSSLQNLSGETQQRLLRQVGHIGSFACIWKDAELFAPVMFTTSKQSHARQSISSTNLAQTTRISTVSNSRISDADRLMIQEPQHYFYHRTGLPAGVVNLIAPEFNPARPEQDK
ncbi:MAG TPA: protein kinase [Planktothrix sp.]